MNTRIMPVHFNYVKPATLAEALDVLASRKNVKILAGGTDLIVKLKTGAIEIDTMLDAKAIPELTEVKELTDGSVEIGALAKLSHIEDNPVIKEKYVALEDALHAMASIAVRNMGTIGGNLCNASPVADTAGPCMVYGAKVKAVSKAGERIIDIHDFFTGLGKTALNADEMLVSVILPAPEGAAAFKKITRVKPDIAKVSCTAALVLDGKTVKDARLAMGAVAVTPLCMCEIAKEMVGKEVSEELFAEIGQKVSDAINPIDDNRSTADYRKKVAKVLVVDVLTDAMKRAGGEF
mgnify:FL=1